MAFSIWDGISVSTGLSFKNNHNYSVCKKKVGLVSWEMVLYFLSLCRFYFAVPTFPTNLGCRISWKFSRLSQLPTSYWNPFVWFCTKWSSATPLVLSESLKSNYEIKMKCIHALCCMLLLFGPIFWNPCDTSDKVWTLFLKPRNSPENWSLVLFKMVIWGSLLTNSGAH